MEKKGDPTIFRKMFGYPGRISFRSFILDIPDMINKYIAKLFHS